MINRTIASRYRILERVGIGGMAEVYKAQDEVLGRIDAVKVLLPQFASDPTFAARFRQEAQAAANLSSPYIVGIYDWGLDKETYYIVMEYVRGVDLKTAITQRGAIDQRKVAQIASQICSGLSVAHSNDVIHRDIKPQNVMIQPDGNIKIMDFGVARAGNSTMTQTGSVLGTANYVSPEQAQGKIPTAASDLYSLGILMYEAVTGRLPFEGPDAISVALKQVNERPLPPSRYNPTIKPEFEAIILKAMEKDPSQRFESADEMRTAINNFLNGNPVNIRRQRNSATTQVIGAGGAGGASSTRVIGRDGGYGTAVKPVVPGADGVRRPDQKSGMSGGKKALIAILIIAAIAVVGVGVWFFMSNGNKPVTAPNVIGQTQGAAEIAIIDAGFEVGNITQDFSDTVAKGNVISQDPAGGTELEKGSKINITVSQGVKPPDQTIVPDLTGMTAEQAGEALASHNLTSVAGDAVHDQSVEPGRVAKQNPAAGATVNEGTSVTFYISLGAETVTVPSVVGYSESYASSILSESGLSYEIGSYQYSDYYDAGFVCSQSPSEGTNVDTGTTITLKISMGPEPEPEPEPEPNPDSGDNGSSESGGSSSSSSSSSSTE